MNTFNDSKDNNTIGKNLIIEGFVKEGDLVKIEFFSQRYNQRVTRLFEVETVLNGRVRLVNAHMSFLICDNEFMEKQYGPVIKSIIPIEKLTEIEQKYPAEQNIKRLVIKPTKKGQ